MKPTKDLNKLSQELIAKYPNVGWLKRGLTEDFPHLKDEEGNISTHRLAYRTENDKAFVYPTMDYIDGKLVEMEDDEAFSYALANKTLVESDDIEVADYFSREGFKKAISVADPIVQKNEWEQFSSVSSQKTQPVKQEEKTIEPVIESNPIEPVVEDNQEEVTQTEPPAELTATEKAFIEAEENKRNQREAYVKMIQHDMEGLDKIYGKQKYKTILDLALNTGTLSGLRQDGDIKINTALTPRIPQESMYSMQMGELERNIGTAYAEGRRVARESGSPEIMTGITANLIDAKNKGITDTVANEMQSRMQTSSLNANIDTQNAQMQNQARMAEEQMRLGQKEIKNQILSSSLTNYSKIMSDALVAYGDNEQQKSMLKGIELALKGGVDPKEIEGLISRRYEAKGMYNTPNVKQ
jgi:hypothetical protein